MSQKLVVMKAAVPGEQRQVLLKLLGMSPSDATLCSAMLLKEAGVHFKLDIASLPAIVVADPDHTKCLRAATCHNRSFSRCRNSPLLSRRAVSAWWRLAACEVGLCSVASRIKIWLCLISEMVPPFDQQQSRHHFPDLFFDHQSCDKHEAPDLTLLN